MPDSLSFKEWEPAKIKDFLQSDIDVKHLWRRVEVRKILQSRFMELFLACLISANFILCILEADNSVASEEPPVWMTAVNHIFSATYTVETLLRIYAFGCKFWEDPWWVTDAMIVFLDDITILVGLFVGDALPSVSMMRILRLLRLSRTKRILQMVPEFAMQVECMLGAFKPMCWGLLLILFAMLVFSVLAVFLIHPINEEVTASGLYVECDRCPHAFESVGMSLMTTSQHLLFGDSWGVVSLPIIQRQPLSAAYFFSAYIVLCLILLNSILGAVVDATGQARNGNDRIVAREKKSERRNARDRLLKICFDLDLDKDGCITNEELQGGVTGNDDFAALLQRMDIESEDLDVIWQLLDSDHSGTVEYKEFVTELFKMRSNDQRTLLVFIRYYVQQIRAQIEDQLLRLNNQILVKVGELARLENHEIDMLRGMSNSVGDLVDTSKDNSVTRNGASKIRPEHLTTLLNDSSDARIIGVSPPSSSTKNVPKLAEPAQLADFQALLQNHWEQQQQILVELIASVSAPFPHMYEKDGPKNVQGNHVRQFAQPLSPPAPVGSCKPGDSPLEPPSPKWHVQGWPE